MERKGLEKEGRERKRDREGKKRRKEERVQGVVKEGRAGRVKSNYGVRSTAARQDPPKTRPDLFETQQRIAQGSYFSSLPEESPKGTFFTFGLRK